MTRPVALAAAVFFAAPAPAADDPVLTLTVDGVEVQVATPPGVKAYRGVLVFAANHTYKADDRWAVFCREAGFAQVVMNIPKVAGAQNRGPRLFKALHDGLKAAAGKTNHPELLTAPLAGHGHSAGGLVTGVLFRTPERVLTTAVDCGWIADPADPGKWPAEVAGVPALFTLGAVPDGFKMLPGVEANFEPARKKGLPWGLGVQWGCAHDYGNAATLTIPWLKAVAAARIPDGGGKLKDVKLEDGWLGDRATTDGTFATVAPWAEFKGDREKAAWLPNREVALVWRAWQTKKSPLVLEASAGDARLPPWDPKKGRTLLAGPGVAVELGVTVAAGTAVAKVRYFDGDRLIGEAAAAPWGFTWKDPPAGTHPVWAEWTDATGKVHAANPALVAVRFKE